MKGVDRVSFVESLLLEKKVRFDESGATPGWVCRAIMGLANPGCKQPGLWVDKSDM